MKSIIATFQVIAIYSSQEEREFEEVMDDSDEYCRLLENVTSEFGSILTNVLEVKCAAHTLQLAVRDAINKSNVKSLIDVCAIGVKLLRKPHFLDQLRDKEINHIIPRLACKTRWSSSFLMVDFI